MYPKMFDAAVNFFQCNPEDLTIENKAESGIRQINGLASQNWLFSAKGHTKTICEVNFDAVFDTVTASEYKQEDVSVSSKLCVCDFSNRGAMTWAEWGKVVGHFNQVNGYCCPHHGNTCGKCKQYD